jgi:hypothetical protein
MYNVQTHRPKTDIVILCMKRKRERRFLLQIEMTYKADIINIVQYLNTKLIEDQFYKYCNKSIQQLTK